MGKHSIPFASVVAAVDPSVTFIDVARRRYPSIELHCAGAELLPLPDDTFDAALAQPGGPRHERVEPSVV